jgi:drug/metabolite transporter (DMT)-like permease
MTVTTTHSTKGLVPFALVTLYVVWGSTYLAVRYLVEEFPALIGSGLRLVVAGGVLYAWLRFRGHPAPTRIHWRNGAITGTLLFLGGMGLVAIAEQRGIGSGLTATAVGTVPVWAVLVAGFWGQRPTRAEWMGLAVGLAGVVLLSREGDFVVDPLGLALVVISPLLWAIGSVWGSHAEMPAGAMTTAIQMLCGSVALAIVGVGRGERFDAIPAASGWWALLYLIVVGSLIGFSSYAYLIRTVRPALATSYAYANPVIAVFLGIWIGNEHLTGPVWVALPLIVCSVALIALAGTGWRRVPVR